MIKQKEIKQFVNYCLANLDLTQEPPQGYKSVPLSALDAIFSIGIRYTTVCNIIERFCAKLELDWRTSRVTTSEVIAKIENVEMNTLTTEYLSANRTSSKNGILKAEAYRQALSVLKANKIESCSDVVQKANDNTFESAFKAIPGQGSGVSLKYFYMLCGNEGLVKPDRHIIRFVSMALNRPTLTNQELKEIPMLFEDACQLLKKEQFSITPRRIDYIIWDYMRQGKKR